jgi:transcriptional regulator with XRE-family HTH domain
MKLSNKAKKNFEEDNQFYIDLGKRLRQARRTKVNEFTGKETVVPLTKVAKALKCSYQQIGKYERGGGKEGNRIPLVNLVKISKFLKKPLSYFLDDYKELDVVSEEFNIAFENEKNKIFEAKQKEESQ